MDIGAFEKSEVFEVLSHNARWDVFRDPGTSREEWFQLNPEFNNAEHLYVTASIAGDICFEDNVDLETTDGVMLTALAHDAVEAITGDLNYNLKSKADEDNDYLLLGKLIDQGMLPMNQNELVTVQTIMKDSQSHEPATEAGIIFKLSEYVGYLQTGFRSYTQSKSDDLEISVEQRTALRWLALDPIANALPVVLRYASRNSVKGFLDENRALIDELLEGYDGAARKGHDAFYLSKQLPLARFRARIDNAAYVWQAYTAAVYGEPVLAEQYN